MKHIQRKRPSDRKPEDNTGPISPSVGRAERLSKYTGDYRAPSLSNIIDEDRIGYAGIQRRERP